MTQIAPGRCSPACDKTQRSYDALAQQYTENISNELDHRPLERDLLRRFAEACDQEGLICDIGCGPGHIAQFVARSNPEVFGLDLSHGLLRQAARQNPNLPFLQADMRQLPFATGRLSGASAFYSLVHFDLAEVKEVLQEITRVLRPSGHLLLGFHVGSDTLHVDELWEVAVNLDFRFFTTEQLTSALRQAGLEIVETVERPPHPEVEHQSVRGYIWAQKPAHTQSR